MWWRILSVNCVVPAWLMSSGSVSGEQGILVSGHSLTKELWVIHRFLTPAWLQSLLYNRCLKSEPSWSVLFSSPFPFLWLFSISFGFVSAVAQPQWFGWQGWWPGAAAVTCAVSCLQLQLVSWRVFSSSTWDASSHHTPWAFIKGFVQAESNSQVKFRQWHLNEAWSIFFYFFF